MIKRIQLRGISRTPSDRMNDDGGVAESLNTYIAEAESAPALPPEDVAEKLGLPVIDPSGGFTREYRCVYIHNVGNENHFIYVLRTEIPKRPEVKYTDALYAYPGRQLIFSGVQDELIIDSTVTSIGNTIIFSTTRGNGYAIYKNGEYVYLGREIPQPQLDVYPKLYTGLAKLSSAVIVYPDTSAGQSKKISPASAFDNKAEKYELYEAKSTRWNDQINKDDSDRDEEFGKIMKKFWDGIQEDLYDTQYFRYPTFVRFALKLYDESYVYHTVPIFMGGGKKRAFEAKLVYRKEYSTDSGSSGGMSYKTSIQVNQDFAYKIMSKLNNADAYDNWKDVVQSIDMFITPPILYPEMRSVIASCDDSVETPLSNDGVVRTMTFRFQDPSDTAEEKRGIEDALLDGSRLFYKVRSFSMDNINELSEGFEQKNTKQLSYTENLATHDTLPDDFRSSNMYSAEKNYIVNRRLLSVGMTETFGRGMQSLYALYPTTSASALNTKSYTFVYEIKDNDGSLKYVHGPGRMNTPVLDSMEISSRPHRVDGGDAPTQYNSDVCQLLFYPDSRCSAVYVIDEQNHKMARLEMKSHPHLNCAYYIGDISKPLSDLEFTDLNRPEEDRTGTSYKNSYLFQSGLENPFYFPVSGRIKFSANLIAVAAISTALSEGQYGQFELYAFTDNGIWVLTPNDEGTYSRINPLSRDVCISAESVVSIDQAVVFVTAKGVMMLEGSKIVNLSPAMTGRHYSMEDAAMDVLMRHGVGKDFRHVLLDKTPFMDFMGKDGRTQIAYDYAGSRLVFFNPAFNYEYVYMLGTGTWHKYVMDIQKENRPALRMNILNSYPDCYMFCRDTDGGLHMYNWSTILDVLDETTQVTGIIASRPFDLGEPDILKTINHLRIRGQYERYIYVISNMSEAEYSAEEMYDVLAQINAENEFTMDELRKLAAREPVEHRISPERIAKINEGLERIDEALRFTLDLEPRVSYILLGSQDGIRFHQLGSLRGKSWKLFRIVILSKLLPTERISWIDVDYETRFTNKLR